jgi:hypothetical protein
MAMMSDIFTSGSRISSSLFWSRFVVKCEERDNEYALAFFPNPSSVYSCASRETVQNL